LFKRGLNLFVDWYGKSVDEILAERKDDLTLRPNESLIDAKQRVPTLKFKDKPFKAYNLKQLSDKNG